MSDLYHKPLNLIPITNNGVEYRALDLSNYKILYAKLTLFDAMFLPADKSYYSNIMYNFESKDIEIDSYKETITKKDSEIKLLRALLASALALIAIGVATN